MENIQQKQQLTAEHAGYVARYMNMLLRDQNCKDQDRLVWIAYCTILKPLKCYAEILSDQNNDIWSDLCLIARYVLDQGPIDRLVIISNNL
jgi:hypothetical protein